MWSSKSVVLISVVSTSIAIIVTLIIRQKIQLYIEKSAQKLASKNNQNEHFSSAFQSIGGSKDVQSVIPQTGNKVVRKKVAKEEDEYVAPPGSGQRWTRL